MNMDRIVADSLQGRGQFDCLSVDGKVKFKYISDKMDVEWTAGGKISEVL